MLPKSSIGVSANSRVGVHEEAAHLALAFAFSSRVSLDLRDFKIIEYLKGHRALRAGLISFSLTPILNDFYEIWRDAVEVQAYLFTKSHRAR